MVCSNCVGAREDGLPGLGIQAQMRPEMKSANRNRPTSVDGCEPRYTKPPVMDSPSVAAVFGDRIDQPTGRASGRLVIVCTFAAIPAVVAATLYRVDFLIGPLAHVGDPHRPLLRSKLQRQGLRKPQA